MHSSQKCIFVSKHSPLWEALWQLQCRNSSHLSIEKPRGRSVAEDAESGRKGAELFDYTFVEPKLH